MQSFQPCGSDKAYWVVGDASVVAPLKERSGRLAATKSAPYQPLYIEAVIVLEPPATDGFAADYDGVARIISVEATADASPEGCATHAQQQVPADVLAVASLRRGRG